MPLSPTAMEAKITKVLEAWENLKKTKSFGGMTFDQFKEKVRPSLEARATIASLERQLGTAVNARDDADKDSSEVLALVVNAVKGDHEEGEDSALYEAMGYVRKSERKSGLRRGKKDKKLAA